MDGRSNIHTHKEIKIKIENLIINVVVVFFLCDVQSTLNCM